MTEEPIEDRCDDLKVLLVECLCMREHAAWFPFRKRSAYMLFFLAEIYGEVSDMRNDMR